MRTGWVQRLVAARLLFYKVSRKSANIFLLGLCGMGFYVLGFAYE
jgi:hypothetical protein